MPRRHRLRAVGLAAFGALALGSPPASAIVSPPTVPGACSARTAVPQTTASFVHCRALGRSGSCAQWIDVTNSGPADVVDAQVRVRVNGQAGTASAPVDLALPARLRNSPTGAWTAWAAAPAFSCPR